MDSLFITIYNLLANTLKRGFYMPKFINKLFDSLLFFLLSILIITFYSIFESEIFLVNKSIILSLLIIINLLYFHLKHNLNIKKLKILFSLIIFISIFSINTYLKKQNSYFNSEIWKSNLYIRQLQLSDLTNNYLNTQLTQNDLVILLGSPSEKCSKDNSNLWFYNIYSNKNNYSPYSILKLKFDNYNYLSSWQITPYKST